MSSLATMEKKGNVTVLKEGGPSEHKKARVEQTTIGKTQEDVVGDDDDDDDDDGKSIPEISLNEFEIKLFDLLRGAAAKAGQSTVLRVAGGWVRDKLLARTSDDIDLALDNVSGTTFAESVNQYMADQGLETHTIGVVQANPDQSKHLETAKVLIMGQWVDFTNLRTETYRADSRIPEITFGTAQEDAYRRDFTINSLFYNLNTSAVEDVTGQGLNDLLGPHGVIRTPLPAHTTFLDDPLRLLRAIRFAARFDLPLHEDIRNAAQDSELRKALIEKVSRERVGIEIEGMLSGTDARPAVAFELLVSLGLANCVFYIPAEAGSILEGKGDGEQSSSSLWENEGLETVQMTNLLLMHRENPSLLQSMDDRDDIDALIPTPAYRRPRRDHRLLFLASVLIRWVACPAMDKKKKEIDAIQLLVREALKFKNKDGDDLALLFRLVDQFQFFASQPCAEIQRVKLGLLLRETKDLWRIGFDLACVREMAKIRASRRSREGTAGGSEPLSHIIDRYSHIKAQADDMGLDGCWSLKPLLDGKAIIGSLGLQKGPMVGQVMTEQVRWQLENPKGTVEELTDHLRAFVAEASR